MNEKHDQVAIDREGKALNDSLKTILMKKNTSVYWSICFSVPEHDEGIASRDICFDLKLSCSALYIKR